MSVGIENELKYRLYDFNIIQEILSFLSRDYIIYPYDKTILYDWYYDTLDFDFLKRGMSYRIRNKRNRSINFKTKGDRISSLYSRFEYRDSLARKISVDEILKMRCDTNDMAQNMLRTTDLQQLIRQIVLCSYRTSFLLYYKDGNEIKKFAVCSFDKYFGILEQKTHYELEIEACEDILYPGIMEKFCVIEEYIKARRIYRCDASKYAVIMKDRGVYFD